MTRRLSVLALCLGLASAPGAEEVVVRSLSARPGETIHLEIPARRGDRPVVHWDDAAYPFYPLKNRFLRALVPVAMNTPPGEIELRIEWPRPVSGGLKAQTVRIQIQPFDFGKETIVFDPEKTKLLDDPVVGEESRAIRGRVREETETDRALWSGLWNPPVPGATISPYGIVRRKVGMDSLDYHRGVDLKGKTGDPIRAPAGGTVILAEPFKVHGNTVVLSHGHGIGSIYIHMSRIDVAVGDKVKMGQKIGEVGMTGLATAPHLHWGLYVHGKPVDPLQWLRDEF